MLHESSYSPVILPGLRRSLRPDKYTTPSSTLLAELRLKNLKDNDRACEDYYVIRQDQFGGMVTIIGDGVSRSSIGDYPFPSPAALASERATLTMADILSSNHGFDPWDAMLYAFQYGNQAVADLNAELGITPATCDYYVNDLASCCAAAVTQRPDGLLTIGAIGDCQVQIFNSRGEQLFETPNFVAPLEEVRANLDCSREEKMVKWRRDMRNHPEVRDTYGTITGEPGALNYLHGYYHRPVRGDMVVLHTDGMEPFTRFPKFIEFLRTGPSPDQLAQVVNWYLGIDGLITGPARTDDKTLIAFQV